MTDFAWTATGGYRFFPPYIRLNGHKLIVRGPEVDDKMGARIEMELPQTALDDLAAALAKARGDA